MNLSPSLTLDARLARIRLLLLDVDGVLTDGRLYYGPEGECLKAFNVRDGLGLRLVQNAGIQLGIVTGRKGPALAARCRDLGIELVFSGVRDKLALLPTISARTGVPAEETAFVADDLVDLALMGAVGLAVAVADADPAVRRAAHWVTEARGGHGAVREVCQRLLVAQGRWDGIVDQMRSPR
ncbi:MAG TPA: phenylphosphate carboxylase subunit delta [Desulfobacteraceae bacterium]|nr:HAD hydrolase family protein [Deltaproteobacteria bacterium]MBW2355851.1 HAD hydrolase family protein [Deltaproteobacteria bacterium]RLB95823.1 MAG: phenylphosphate carboxylase subunit delta [Deltaproteobacteria bacterium]HDI58817.1 phenylphosphate carboxylase subunit delta [Desulfobacteraceae bacterium]